MSGSSSVVRMAKRASSSFRLKIMTLVLFAAVLPALCLAVLSHLRQTQLVWDANENLLKTTARESARQIAAWLKEQQDTATAFGHSGELVLYWKEFQREASHPESDRYYQAQVQLHRVMTNCDESSRWIDEVRLSNNEGKVLLSNNQAAVNGNFVVAEGGVDVRRITQDNQTVTSAVYASVVPVPTGIEDDDEQKVGVPTLLISAPVRGEAETFGILGCRLAVSDLKRLLPEEANQIPLQVNVLTTDGRLISGNRDAEERLQPFPIPRAQRGSWPTQGDNLEGFPDLAGTAQVGAWQRVPGTDMVVLVSIDAHRLYDEVRPLRWVLAFFLVLTLGIGAWAFVRAGILLQPLRVLTRASQQLSLGDMSVRVNAQEGDEFGQLGQTFDQMAATMETTLSAMALARDEALAASHAKSRFLANMTHELRTPLNAVIGYSEMIMGEVKDGNVDNSQLLEDLEVIRTSGKDLLALINSILDFSKIEAGKMAISPEELEVQSLLKEIAQTIVPLVAKNENKFVLEAPDSLGEAYLDPMRVKQILLNLLSNACKFTSKGTIRLSARSEGESLVMEVTDSGIGMNAEEQSRIFQEFSQADDSISRRFGGTGLGLAIVQRLVQMMDGSIVCTSEPQKGSTFVVTLPRRLAIPPA